MLYIVLIDSSNMTNIDIFSFFKLTTVGFEICHKSKYCQNFKISENTSNFMTIYTLSYSVNDCEGSWRFNYYIYTDEEGNILCDYF